MFIKVNITSYINYVYNQLYMSNYRKFTIYSLGIYIPIYSYMGI